MLKGTANEETRLFCQIFVIGGILIEEARAPLATSLGYAYDFEIRSRPKFFLKKKTFEANFKTVTFILKRGGLESSHLTVF